MTYTVALDAFSGPLDLLLYLVQKEEVEITDIPIAVICDRYLEYLRGLEELDVDVAAEFLVMASTLMLIKSRSLLPIEEEVDLEEELDPEDELIQQLLEYKKFKIASRGLETFARERARIRPFRPPNRAAEEEEEIELEEVDVVDLVRAFAALLRETGLSRGPRVVRDERPLREYVEEVFAFLRERRTVRFSGLFEGRRDRETVIGRFLALLELTRRGRVRAVQVGVFGEIDLVLVDDRDLSEEEWELVEVEMGRDEDELLDLGADRPQARAGPEASSRDREAESGLGAS